ncbi:MFS transporter [Fibrella sp. HMF5335]|uniref:MFS transporter n=1 Tax=Fibrella rubiginis TaxID=2817060 RepID=A0A939K367_9BACT|nr:MFS transporter [Fibrella rubiginis]MBO0938917.1 MFS transporter [Fibrella rubiginis]
MPFLSHSRPLRYATFGYLYIMQGLPSGFALIAVTNYLASEGVTPPVIATFGAVVGLPWGVKFMWGPLVDRFQGLAMGRRRPWVLLAQVLAFGASLGVLLTTDPMAGFNQLMWAFALHGVFASLQDVSVDAMAITVTPEAERGRVNALMKIGMATGQAIGGAGLAYLLRHGGFQLAALVQSAVLLGFTFVTLFIRESPGDAVFSFRYISSNTIPAVTTAFGPLLRELGRALLSPRSMLLFLGVAILFVGERLFQRVYSLHLIQKEGWTDTAVSVLSGTYGTLVAVSLALVGGWLSDYFGARRMLLCVGAGMALLHVGFGLLGTSTLGTYWADTGVATAGLIVRQTMDPVLSIAALPVLMALCRPGVAGAQFAVYMALSNQADVLGIWLSGQLFPLFSAPVLAVACGLSMALATAVVGLAIGWNRQRSAYWSAR